MRRRKRQISGGRWSASECRPRMTAVQKHFGTLMLLLSCAAAQDNKSISVPKCFCTAVILGRHSLALHLPPEIWRFRRLIHWVQHVTGQTALAATSATLVALVAIDTVVDIPGHVVMLEIVGVD